MTAFEFAVCDEDAARIALYIQTAEIFDDVIPVEALKDLCGECRTNAATALRDGPDSLA